MTKKLWIFGDSYSYHHTEPEFSYSWPAQIKNTFEVKNFSCIGSSADWSLQKIMTEMNNSDTSDVTVLFFLTEPYRQNWNFWEEPKHHWLTTYIGMDSNFFSDATHLTKKYKYYSKFIKTWFRSLNDEYLYNEYYKNIGLINLCATKFEKVLIWPCFDRIPILGNLNNNVILSSISMKEFESETIKDRFDERPNHLTETNHNRMLKIITNWIDSEELNV
jgi:hypothetical protein